MLVEKDEMQAVHNDDLETFLKSLGVYESVVAGTEVCFCCGKIINLDNLQCIFPVDKDIKFCCSEEICYRELVNKGVIDNK